MWIRIMIVVSNMLLFMSMAAISLSILILIQRKRIGMAVGRLTWLGLAIFLFLCGVADLFEALVTWFPLTKLDALLHVLLAILGVGGSGRMLLKAREAQRIPQTELDQRYELYHDAADNLEKMRQLLIMRESGESPKS